MKDCTDAMAKDTLVIFGRSLFIDQVDVGRIISKHTTAGINALGLDYPVRHLFYFDMFIPGYKAHTLHLPYWFKQPGEYYCKVNSTEPMLTKQYRHGALCLGFEYFTVSAAINWAMLEGDK